MDCGFNRWMQKDLPVIWIAPTDLLLKKLSSNLSEVTVRGGELYVCYTWCRCNCWRITWRW